MSSVPTIYPIFNPYDFQEPTFITNLTTDTHTSASISSSDIVISNVSGGSDSVATQPWVTTQIANAVSTLSGGSLSSNLSTLQSIDDAINNDPDFFQKLPYLASNNVYTGTNTFNDGLSVTGTVVLPNNAISNIMINNSCISSGYCDATSSIQSQLNGKQATLTFDSTPTASSTNPVTSGGVYTDTNSLQTQINSLNSATTGLTYSSGTTTLSENLSCNNGISVTGNVILPNNAISNIMINNSCINNGYCDATSSIQTQLNGKQSTLTFDSTPTSASTNPVTSGGIYTSLQNYLTTSNASSTYLTDSTASSTYLTQSSASSTYLTQSSASSTYLTQSSASSNYLTDSTASSTYLSQSSASSTYLTQSNASSTYVPQSNASLSGVTTIAEVSEKIYIAGSGTNLTLSYPSIFGVIYYSPSANFTITLSSVPTTSTSATYSFTLIYNTQYYCNAITVNGTSRTMIAGNGLANISINSSATYVMQSVNICFLNSSTPTVITNVISLF